MPAGTLAFAELPAGMLDEEAGAFAGVAARELQEETGLTIAQDELVDMTAQAALEARAVAGLGAPGEPESGMEADDLQPAVYPSAGGCDEFVGLLLCRKHLPAADIQALSGRLTGLRREGERITLKVVPFRDLWLHAAGDGKAMAALGVYHGLRGRRLI